MNLDSSIELTKTIATLRNLPGKKRLDAIIDHPRPMELIRALESHDILLTLREVGAEDSLELIELLSPEQVQGVLDFEIWQSDQIYPEKAGGYFSLLFAANKERAVKQIHGLDIELVGLMFKMVARIYDTTLSEEPVEYPNLYSTSPDGRFIVCFDESPKNMALSQSLHAFLESLYGQNIKVALGLLEDIRFELASGLEETSLRMRQNRLLDMGILPREERLEYFAPLSTQALKNTETNHPHTLFNREECNIPVRRFLENVEIRFPFLYRAIHEASLAEQQSYLDYLSHAAINMHASLIDDFGDAELIKKTARYVKSLAELGLWQASQGNSEHAAALLKNNSIKAMIRLGRTSLINLRKSLVLLQKDPSYCLGQDFSLLDSPLREVAKALSLSEPRFYEGLVDPKKLNVRFFDSIEDVAVTLKAIHEIKFRSYFMGKNVLGFLEQPKNSTISHGGLYARYLINSFLQIADRFQAISSFDKAKIFLRDGKLDDNFVQHSKRLTDQFAKKCAQQSNNDDDKLQQLSHHFNVTVLVQLEQNHHLLLG